MEVDQDNIPNDATSVKQWFDFEEAGTIDIKQFYKNGGKDIRCGTRYRLKIAVRNGCKAWVENAKIFTINPCFQANAGLDQGVCRNDANSTAQIGLVYPLNTIPVGTTFAWEPSSLVGSPTATFNFVRPAGTTTYTLTATSVNGCLSKDEVTVYIQDPPSLTITDNGKFCTRKVKATVISEKPYAFKWLDNNSTDFERTISSYYKDTLEAQVTNSCGTVQASREIPETLFTGNFPENTTPTDDDLLFPATFNPPGPIVDNRYFFVSHKGIGTGLGPAYNAIEANLTIVDRWGGIMTYRSSAVDLGRPLVNRDVRWDGNFSGSPAIDGVYPWYLTLTNCERTKQVSLDAVYKCKGGFFGLWTHSCGDYPIYQTNVTLRR